MKMMICGNDLSCSVLFGALFTVYIRTLIHPGFKRAPNTKNIPAFISKEVDGGAILLHVAL
jgi:hypothetical protein